MNNSEKEFAARLVGEKLFDITCEAEILDVQFGTLVLHGMGLTRIKKTVIFSYRPLIISHGTA